MSVRFLKSLFSPFIISILNYRTYCAYRRQFKRYLLRQGFKNTFVEGEDKYKELWSKLSRRVEPYSYRFFSHYCGKTPYIIPEDIGHTVIERILNPERFRAYYSDKNMYAQYIRKEYLPDTILCRINGCEILNEKNIPLMENEIFPLLLNYSRVILKPSIDSCGGAGVMLFEKMKDGRWIAKKENIELTYSYLLQYSNNFVLQNAIEQYPYLAQFNPTSVNTLRLTVYRSVRTEKVVVPSAIMRIGKCGEIVDNIHAGAVCVGLNPKTGDLMTPYVLNQYGDKFKEWNNIDYSQHSFKIPNWEKVLKLAEYIGSANKHCRLLALDITINKLGEPILIEYNCDGFSFGGAMRCGQIVFGEYTEEVISYCIEKMRLKKYLLKNCVEIK